MEFGVSPAWFLSLFGETFSVEQAGESLSRLAALGFISWQPEIFLPEALEDWKSGRAEELRYKSEDLGLCTKVFVAHFLGQSFSGESALGQRTYLSQMKQLLEALENWSEISIVVIPVPSFTFNGPVSQTRYGDWLEAMADRLVSFAVVVESSGRRLALEVMPGNLVGGSGAYASFLKRDGMGNIGINYDTGHFHASGESQAMLMGRLGSRIVSTHLCDNDGIRNLSLAPGDGSVDWNQVTEGLQYMGYQGSYDLEIRCPAGTTEESYRRGREFLEQHKLKESA